MEQLRHRLGERHDLIEAISPHVGGPIRERLTSMGDASLFNMMTALIAVSTPGVSGDLMLRIPPKVNDRVEVSWRSSPDV